jgi:hypothetical protein
VSGSIDDDIVHSPSLVLVNEPVLDRELSTGRLVDKKRLAPGAILPHGLPAVCGLALGQKPPHAVVMITPPGACSLPRSTPDPGRHGSAALSLSSVGASIGARRPQRALVSIAAWRRRR